jgi:hypothetical protein
VSDSAGEPALDLVPFGIDPEGETVFAWNLASPRDEGELEVVLWTNGIGERFASFPAFLEIRSPSHVGPARLHGGRKA